MTNLFVSYTVRINGRDSTGNAVLKDCQKPTNFKCVRSIEKKLLGSTRVDNPDYNISSLAITNFIEMTEEVEADETKS